MSELAKSKNYRIHHEYETVFLIHADGSTTKIGVRKGVRERGQSLNSDIKD